MKAEPDNFYIYQHIEESNYVGNVVIGVAGAMYKSHYDGKKFHGVTKKYITHVIWPTPNDLKEMHNEN